VTELQSAGARKVKGKDVDGKFSSLRGQGALPRNKASKKPRNAKAPFATPAKAVKKSAPTVKARKR